MKGTIKAFLAIWIASLLVISCPSESLAHQCNSLAECHRLYEGAIVDAGTYEASEVEQLLPVLDEKVAVATWTSWTGYREGANTLGIDVWVTVVPQLREKCATFTGIGNLEDLNLRLEQLLGLPPKDSKTLVVEMDIEAGDLFRPCPNPEISSTECDRTFPEPVAPAYVDWFATNVLDSYQIPNGYPWTRLGYTYDWNPDSPEMGLSEYVVRRGASVNVTSIRSTADYCNL